MNEDQTSHFADLIYATLKQISEENALGQQGQAVVTLDQQSVGRLSRMDALQNQAMAKAQQVRRDQQSKRLRAALQRIEAGEFGYCTDCGDEIDPSRLELNPAVTICISCAKG